MQFGRGVQDLVGFLFEAGASEERRLHQQSSQVAGMGREIGFACGGGTLVIPARGEGFRSMEFSRGIPHLGRSRKRLRRLREKSAREDRKSTRLNSSHSQISYAVFCLKKKK